METLYVKNVFNPFVGLFCVSALYVVHGFSECNLLVCHIDVYYSFGPFRTGEIVLPVVHICCTCHSVLCKCILSVQSTHQEIDWTGESDIDKPVLYINTLSMYIPALCIVYL